LNTHHPSDEQPIESQSWSWLLHFLDGSHYSNIDGPWADISTLVQLGEMQVYETMNPVAEVWVRHRNYPEQIHKLCAPQERRVPFFAFHRFATPILVQNNEEETWLYTCFGYQLPTYRVLLLLTPEGFISTTQPTTTPFSI
jgi:hypothetical protein